MGTKWLPNWLPKQLSKKQPFNYLYATANECQVQQLDGFVSLPNKKGKPFCCATLPSSQAVADSLQHFAHFELLPTQNALAMLLGWLK